MQGVSFSVRAGEIVCLAGIDGNGQSELIYGLTGLEKCSGGSITLCGEEISHTSIRKRLKNISHIPEDRHKHGLVLDFTLEQNMVLQRFQEPKFQKFGFIKQDAVRSYAEVLIDQYDVRSGQGPITVARSMSGGNQQKAIIAREVDRDKPLIVAVQPTRGLDVGAIEYIHSQLVAERDRGKAILLVSLELDEVMSLSDRILVLYEGEIVGELDPKKTNIQELGLYMAGAKRAEKGGRHGMKPRMSGLMKKEATRSILASILSIIIGLVVGCVIILIVGMTSDTLSPSSAWDGIRLIFWRPVQHRPGCSGSLDLWI